MNFFKMFYTMRSLDIMHLNSIWEKGDFITSPKISFLFSEMIAVWIISTWELFGKPKNFNVVGLVLEMVV